MFNFVSFAGGRLRWCSGGVGRGCACDGVCGHRVTRRLASGLVPRRYREDCCPHKIPAMVSTRSQLPLFVIAKKSGDFLWSDYLFISNFCLGTVWRAINVLTRLPSLRCIPLVVVFFTSARSPSATLTRTPGLVPLWTSSCRPV